MPDCYLSQSISHAERTNQAVLFMGILACILIGILSIGILLMILMNRMITVPVSKLQTRMVRIAGGDFSRDPSVEWEHELGDIGRGINDLSENVSELMEKDWRMRSRNRIWNIKCCKARSTLISCIIL